MELTPAGVLQPGQTCSWMHINLFFKIKKSLIQLMCTPYVSCISHPLVVIGKTTTTVRTVGVMGSSPIRVLVFKTY